MCCNDNWNRRGCCRPMHCYCPCCSPMPMMPMPMPLPSFPDWGCQEREEMEFPVYISMPATMARGTANVTAGVEMTEGGCGCGRG